MVKDGGLGLKVMFDRHLFVSTDLNSPITTFVVD